MVWSLALCPGDAKQDPVVCGAELRRVHVLHLCSRASIASAFNIRVLNEGANFRYSTGPLVRNNFVRN